MIAKIEFGEDYICIKDEKGEIVYWDIKEWIDDPQIVFPICNAIKIVSEGKNLRKYLNKRR